MQFVKVKHGPHLLQAVEGFYDPADYGEGRKMYLFPTDIMPYQRSRPPARPGRVVIVLHRRTIAIWFAVWRKRLMERR